MITERLKIWILLLVVAGMRYRHCLGAENGEGIGYRI